MIADAGTRVEAGLRTTLPGGGSLISSSEETAPLDTNLGELFERTSTGFLVVDADTHRIEFVNEALPEELDYDREDLLRKPLGKLVKDTNHNHPSDLAEWKHCVPETIECQLRDSNGRSVPFRLDVKADTLDSDDVLLVLARPGDGEGGTASSSEETNGEASSHPTIFDLDNRILGSIMDEVYVFDARTGELLECNRTATERLGYSEEELLEKTIFDFVEEYESLEQWEQKIDAYRRGSSQPVEGHHVRRDGSTYPVEANSTLIRRGDRECLLSVAREITQRRQRERESERLFNEVNDAITVHDTETKELVDVNQTVVDILGYPKEEILRRGIAYFSASDEGFTREVVEQTLEGVIREEVDEPFEWAVYDAQGNKVWFEVSPNRLQWDGKERVLNLSREITDQKERQEQLRFRQSLLKAQQEAADEGILVVSEDREILSYNDQFLDMWEISESVVEEGDRAAVEYVRDQLENPDEFTSTIEELYDERDVTYTDELRKKDGTILERYTSPVQLGDQYFGRVWFFRDVTEKRRVNEQLETSLREKETLLEEVHHRVKNNIQVIISLLKMQMRSHESSELRDSYRDSINRLQTMALIHEELYESEHLASVNFPKYVEELCERLRKSYGRGEETTLRVTVEELDLDIDDSITCGLIVNELVSNAFEHGLKGTSTGVVQVACKVQQDEIRIRVADNGPGFPSGFDLDEVDSTGINIVKSLVGYDLDGSIDYRHEDGLVMDIRIPRDRLLDRG